MSSTSKQDLWQGTEDQKVPFPARVPLSSFVMRFSKQHLESLY